MFQDANQEFIMSFQACEGPETGKPEEQIYRCNIKEAAEFKNDIKQNKMSERTFSKGNKSQEAMSPVRSSSNHLLSLNKGPRRMSQSDFDLKKQTIHFQTNEPPKSHCSDDFGNSQVIVQKSVENEEVADNAEYHPPEQDPQTSFLKKIRMLETKFKSYSLQRQTCEMKLRQENQLLKQQIFSYKKYLALSHPNIIKQLQSFLAIQREKSVSMSSDSSSQKDEASMSVLSQILQVKIEGKKVCDKINNLNAIIAIYDNEKKEERQRLKKEQEEMESKFPPKARTLMRKWSIPCMQIRQKKQSFQTTKLSINQEEHDQEVSISKVFTANYCSKCQQLKSYIRKFNEKLKRIKINEALNRRK